MGVMAAAQTKLTYKSIIQYGSERFSFAIVLHKILNKLYFNDYPPRGADVMAGFFRLSQV